MSQKVSGALTQVGRHIAHSIESALRRSGLWAVAEFFWKLLHTLFIDPALKVLRGVLSLAEKAIKVRTDLTVIRATITLITV
jgi:hypothetical protein